MASSGIPSTITIFFLALPAAAQKLQTATLFTRIHIHATAKRLISSDPAAFATRASSANYLLWILTNVNWLD